MLNHTVLEEVEAENMSMEEFSHWPSEDRCDEMISRVKNGLPFGYFERIKSKLSITDKELSDLIKLPNRTLSRRRAKGQFSFIESERIIRVYYLFKRLINTFGDDRASISWLKSENRALGNNKPIQYLDTELGVRMLENLLEKVEHGVFI